MALMKPAQLKLSSPADAMATPACCSIAQGVAVQIHNFAAVLLFSCNKGSCSVSVHKHRIRLQHIGRETFDIWGEREEGVRERLRWGTV